MAFLKHLLSRATKFLRGITSQSSASILEMVLALPEQDRKEIARILITSAAQVDKCGQLLHAPKLPIRYRGEKFPAEFSFQDPRTYLYNGSDTQEWGWTEFAPFYTEQAQRERFEFMARAAGYLGAAGIKGDYHEFGCFSATTFRMMLTQARLFSLDIPKFWAFDSFQGLPEPDEGVTLPEWSRGTMKMSEWAFRAIIEDHGLFVDRVHTVSGFFADTLTGQLQAQFAKERPIAFVNVDCDLYKSAVPIFRFIEPLMQEGTLIYIDDYYVGYSGSPKKGVAGAFWELAELGRWRFHEFQSVGWWGKSFIAYPK